MMTIMGIAASRLGLDLSGTKVKVAKEMAAAPVRRIARLRVEIAVPRDFTARAAPPARSRRPRLPRSQEPARRRWTCR